MARPQEAKTDAIMKALKALSTEGRHPTLRELSHRSQVSLRDTRSTLSNLVRAGHLEIKSFRRVHYRNRPVAEYGLASHEVESGAFNLGQALGAWRIGA